MDVMSGRASKEAAVCCCDSPPLVMTNDGSAARAAHEPPAVMAIDVSSIILRKRIGMSSSPAQFTEAVIMPRPVVLRCRFSIQDIHGEVFAR